MEFSQHTRILSFAQGWGSIAMGTQTNVLGNYAKQWGIAQLQMINIL